MALFVTHCAICGETITGDTPYVATSGVAFEPDHPLYQFCDTGLHQGCLLLWENRCAFAAGYAMGSGHVLHSEAKWNLICGPLGYGPHGKPGWPYYAEIRLVEWPIRLYSEFEKWGLFVANKEWEKDFIPEINEVIRDLEPRFPQTDAALREYLWQPILNTMQTAPDHRSRYVAAVSLNLYDDAKIQGAIGALEQAMKDEHGSVRNAVHLLLKRLRESPKA